MKKFKEIIHSFLSQKENANPFLSENHDHTCINILINKSNFGNNGLLMAIFIVAMCFISFMFMSNLGAHIAPVPGPFEPEIVPGKKPDFKNPSYQLAHEYASSAPHLAQADKTLPQNTQINLSAFDMKTNNERLSLNGHRADVFPDLLDKPGVLAINTAARMSNAFEITQVQKNAREPVTLKNADEFHTNRTLQKARELEINYKAVASPKENRIADNSDKMEINYQAVASIKDNHIKQNAREPVALKNPHEQLPIAFGINQNAAKGSEDRGDTTLVSIGENEEIFQEKLSAVKNPVRDVLAFQMLGAVPVHPGVLERPWNAYQQNKAVSYRDVPRKTVLKPAHNAQMAAANIQDTSEAQKINTRQADEIKTLVFAVAKCEKKHVNTVHNELKRVFGYYRYRYIDTHTYQQVIQTLNERICSEPE